MGTGKETQAQCWPAWPATGSASAVLSPLSRSVQGTCWLGEKVMFSFAVFAEILPGVEAAQENCEDHC